ncbi:MAG: hypothetical protein MZV70_22530 [Desulfobacterales bacterium]|nr:hypothetical protein [Desulfobacterales bacterium]
MTTCISGAVDHPFIWFSTQPDCLLLYTTLVFAAMRVAAGEADDLGLEEGAVLLGLISGVRPI